MDPWVWIAVYLLGFALLQLLLYRYFRRDVPQGETATPRSSEVATPSAWAASASPDDGAMTCPRCGAENEHDTTYTFCRECVAPLQSTEAVSN